MASQIVTMADAAAAATPARTELERHLVACLDDGTVIVPPYPTVAARIGATLSAIGYKLEALVELVSGDQAIATQLVRLANSGTHAKKLRVATLRDAILRLGEHEVRRLAFTAALGATTAGDGPLVELRRRAWQRNVLAAHIAQLLASYFRLGEEAMFIAGLLHDIGAIVVLHTLEALIAAHGPDVTLAEDDWRALVDRYHVRAGLVVAEHWSLPAQIREVIAQHHHDDEHRRGEHAAAARFMRTIDALVTLIDGGGAVTARTLAPLELRSNVVGTVLAATPRLRAELVSFAPPATPSSISAVRPRAANDEPELDDALTDAVSRIYTEWTKL